MSSRYAATTDVPSDRSRNEIERTLIRYRAGRFAYGWNENDAMIGFETQGRQIKFVLPLPDRNSEEFTLTPTGKTVRDIVLPALEVAYSTGNIKPLLEIEGYKEGPGVTEILDGEVEA